MYEERKPDYEIGLLTDEFEPCDRMLPTGIICGSCHATVRCFKKSNAGYQIGVFCELGHVRTGWSGGYWAPQHLFKESGKFAGAIRSEFLSPTVAKVRSGFAPKNWVVGLFRDYQQREDAKCFACGTPVPHFDPRTEPVRAYNWVNQWDRRLYQEFAEYLDGQGKRGTWYAMISDDLKTAFGKRLADAQIELDHIFPAALQRLASIPFKHRECAARELVVPKCFICNGARTYIKFESRAKLRAQIVPYWADIDSVRLPKLLECFDALYDLVAAADAKRRLAGENSA